MQPQLKPISQQVIVVTGATSDIGLATCRMAARQGARVVMGASDRCALRKVEQEIRQSGGQVAVCTLEAASSEAMQSLADCAVFHFGEIDTWVNSVGASVAGRMESIAEHDHRRLFDVNFWGVVNGSFIALRYVRDQGGAIINVGSLPSEPGLSGQGMGSASKHAVTGFTEAFRTEVEELEEPVSISLVKPAATATPTAEEVALAILCAAVHSRREVLVGDPGAGLLQRMSRALLRQLSDSPQPARVDPPRPGRNPWMALGTLALMGAAVVFLGGGTRSRGKRAKNERATNPPIERQ